MARRDDPATRDDTAAPEDAVTRARRRAHGPRARDRRRRRGGRGRCRGGAPPRRGRSARRPRATTPNAARSLHDRADADTTDRSAIDDRDDAVAREHDADRDGVDDRMERHEPVLAPSALATMRARQRDRFGGIQWGSDFFGWLCAIGLASLLTAALVGAGVALGLSTDDATNADTADQIGLGGGIALILVLAVAWFCGGYVAGRMARFDGVRQGLGVWAWTILAVVVVALVAVIGGSDYDVYQRLNLPRLAVGDSTLNTGGAIAGGRGRRHAAVRRPRRQGRRALPQARGPHRDRRVRRRALTPDGPAARRLTRGHAVTCVLVARIPLAGVGRFRRYEAAVLPLLAEPRRPPRAAPAHGRRRGRGPSWSSSPRQARSPPTAPTRAARGTRRCSRRSGARMELLDRRGRAYGVNFTVMTSPSRIA